MNRLWTDRKVRKFISFRKRACFTELAPTELAAHAKISGPFALEWDIARLRRLGAVRVFYVPLVTGNETNEGIGAALLARLGDVQKILVRLEKLKHVARDNELINLTVNGQVAATCTVQAAADLMSYLEGGIQPVERLDAAIRALVGFFCSMENLTYTGDLGYYRQHEWRIIGNMIHLGVPITSEPSSEEIEHLKRLDETFFMAQIQFATGLRTRASQCQYLRSYGGKPVHHTVRRIICPTDTINEVRNVTAKYGFAPEIASIESLH